ncbi:MAG: type II toxin-antitoxin system VapC family toxin [Deltaproteobacteria bacterium]|nr:type II toxin-antitoxin system VapC family toxin [Deltaproteobacteria bacterium]
MMYWDASAVIPLCLKEPATPVVREIARRDGAIAAWWGTPVECLSAFARLRREGVLATDGERQARLVLSRLVSVWTEILPGDNVREGAARALLLHPLRAADSLQLAAALVWADGRPAGQPFVCLDTRLRESAAREGFRALPE